MKFQVKRQDISHVLDNIESVTDEKSANPILGYVRVSAYEADAQNPLSTVQLAGTNLRIAIETTIPADVESDGCILVLARPLARVIKSLSCDKVSINVTKNNMVVSGVGTSRTHKLAIRSAEDFAKIPTPSSDNEGIPLASETIKSIIGKVSHAMDTAQAAGRNGVMVEIKGGVCSAVSVNSYQLAVFETNVDVSDWECIIPAAMHKPLLDLCGGAEIVRIKKDEKYIFAETEETIIATILPSEQFVPWRKVVEMIHPDPIATLARVDLVNSVKGVTCVSPTATVCLSFKKDGKLHISSISEGADQGEFEANDVIECSTVDKAIELNLSAAFLLANLRSVDSGEVVLRHCLPNQLVVVGPGYHSLIALTSPRATTNSHSSTEPEEEPEEKPLKKRGKSNK